MHSLYRYGDAKILRTSFLCDRDRWHVSQQRAAVGSPAMKESSREEVLHPLATSTPVKGRFSCIDLNDSDSDESQDESLSGLLETPTNKRPRLVDLNDSSSTCTEPSVCSVVRPAKEYRFGMKTDPEGAPILVHIDDSTSNDPEDAVALCQEEQNSVDVKGKLTKALPSGAKNMSKKLEYS